MLSAFLTDHPPRTTTPPDSAMFTQLILQETSRAAEHSFRLKPRHLGTESFVFIHSKLLKSRYFCSIKEIKMFTYKSSYNKQNHHIKIHSISRHCLHLDIRV